MNNYKFDKNSSLDTIINNQNSYENEIHKNNNRFSISKEKIRFLSHDNS